MAGATKETIKQVLREFYNYSVSDDEAASLAAALNVMLSEVEALTNLDVSGLEFPFGYEVLIAEASRIAERRR
jgi:hypothetical protein